MPPISRDVASNLRPWTILRIVTRDLRSSFAAFVPYEILFRIGAANRRRGHRPLGVSRFLEDVRAYRRLARSYPLTH